MKKLISIILVATMVLATIPVAVSQEPEILLGDINGDGLICWLDVALALHFVANLPTVLDNDERALKAALITDKSKEETGKPSIGDALQILMHMARMPSSKLAGSTREECECCYECRHCAFGYGVYSMCFEDYCFCTDDCLGEIFGSDVCIFDHLGDGTQECLGDTCKYYNLGNVNGDCVIDIKDALQTLMYVAGMPSSTLNDSGKNLRAALITDKAKETGEPTIGDALQILMYVADMPGSLLNG